MWTDLLKSKKFLAMIIGMIAAFLSQRFGVAEDRVTEILQLIMTYIVGQGIADAGKEAAKVTEGVS